MRVLQKVHKKNGIENQFVLQKLLKLTHIRGLLRSVDNMQYETTVYGFQNNCTKINFIF